MSTSNVIELAKHIKRRKEADVRFTNLATAMNDLSKTLAETQLLLAQKR